MYHRLQKIELYNEPFLTSTQRNFIQKDNTRSSNAARYSTRFDETLNMLHCSIETNIELIEATIGAHFASTLDLEYVPLRRLT